MLLDLKEKQSRSRFLDCLSGWLGSRVSSLSGASSHLQSVP